MPRALRALVYTLAPKDRLLTMVPLALLTDLLLGI